MTKPPVQTHLSSDHCIKCNLCTAACPVASVTDQFAGPKAVGPQAARFYQPGSLVVEPTVDWCSGCGVCSLVCPHGVQVAEMNVIAKARQAESAGIPLRNRLLGRSERVGQLGSLFAPLSNLPIQSRTLRWMGEKVMGVSRNTIFPRFARPTFRAWFRRNVRPLLIGYHKVLYFHNCATNYYEPRVGKAAVRVLERLACRVQIGEQNCCGLPMQSNGELHAARAYALSNVRKLAPYARDGYIIVGTSTSCTLALKHEYQTVLGLEGEDVRLVAQNTYDFFEFLLRLKSDPHISETLLGLLEGGLVAPAPEGGQGSEIRDPKSKILYHPPCQLKSHYIGQPATAVMRMIPGVEVIESSAACCGVAGTYGLKREKYEVARRVGEALFREVDEAHHPTRVACDSETCRWWIAKHTGRDVVHPVEILAEALGA